MLHIESFPFTTLQESDLLYIALYKNAHEKINNAIHYIFWFSFWTKKRKFLIVLSIIMFWSMFSRCSILFFLLIDFYQDLHLTLSFSLRIWNHFETWSIQFCNPRWFLTKNGSNLEFLKWFLFHMILSSPSIFLMQQKVYLIESFPTECTACFFSL